MSSPLSNPHAWNLVSSGYLEHNLEAFEVFANKALDLAGVCEGKQIVDVATGPGSLATLAAQRGATVAGIDFSEKMLTLARKRCSDMKLSSITFTQGDGQKLPFADASFDFGFSMFGLMFFPNRARGFAELRRVLRPGAKAIVSSWRPMNDIQILTLLFEGLFKAAPELKPDAPPPPPPLSSPEQIISEMSVASFDVEVKAVVYHLTAPDLAHFLASSRTSFAPLCLMEEQVGKARFDEIMEQVGSHMAANLGDDPLEFPMRALLGIGTAR